MSASSTRRKSPSRMWFALVVGLIAIALAVSAVVVWGTLDRHGPQHKADAFSYDTYPSPDRRLEARVYWYVTFFTEWQEVTIRRLDNQPNDTEMSLGCDQAEDGSQISAVLFSSSDTLTLERASFPPVTVKFSPDTLKPVEKLGSC